MSTITESVSYDATVYQIDTTDPVQGGAGGIANKATQNLANRTAYLKQHMDNLENGTTIPSTVAPKNSPIFTGDPQAPTPALGDNDTSIATSAFVQGTINGLLIKSVAGGSNVTLSAIEAGNGIWQFTGALTANIDVILPTPTPTKQMLVLNRTSGAYTLRVKTASGTGVYVAQGKQQEIACDGTNVFQSTNDTAGLVLDPTVAATTAAQFDASTKLATTAFVQRALGSKQGVSAISGNATLGASVVGQLIGCFGNAAYTVTLPAVASLPEGATISFFCTNGAGITVVCSGADALLVNSNAVASLLFYNGDTLQLVKQGTSWIAVGGSLQLRYAGALTNGGFLTQPQFDNSTKLATTAFVQRALGNKQGVAAPTSAIILGAGDAGKFILPNGSASFNVSLPLISSVPAGASFTFLNVCSQVVNVYQQGSDTITNGSQGGLLFIPLQPGDTLDICSNGLGWYVTGGSASLKNAGEFASSLNANGYQKLPSGLILQWGQFTQNDNGSAVQFTATMSIAFPNTALQAFLTPGNAVPTSGSGTVEGMTANIINGFTNGNAATRIWRYFVIGY